jgi:Inositol polyphosphate kinase
MVHSSIKASIINQINQLISILHDQELRLYGASVLIIYDGRGAFSNECVPPRLYLIDFAHSHFQAGIGPDTEVIAALTLLLSYLSN